MIIRVVSLHFHPAQSELGKQILKRVAPKVRESVGCTHLSILFDVHHNGKVLTYSHWDSLDDLKKYRNSEFFITFWSEIQPLLLTKAIARSTYPELTYP